MGGPRTTRPETESGRGMDDLLKVGGWSGDRGRIPPPPRWAFMRSQSGGGLGLSRGGRTPSPGAHCGSHLPGPGEEPGVHSKNEQSTGSRPGMGRSPKTAGAPTPPRRESAGTPPPWRLPSADSSCRPRVRKICPKWWRNPPPEDEPLPPHRKPGGPMGQERGRDMRMLHRGRTRDHQPWCSSPAEPSHHDVRPRR